MAAASRMLWMLAVAGAAPGPEAPVQKPNCDGTFKISGGHGGNQVLIPTGWKNDGYSDVSVEHDVLLPQMGARAYFADTCTAGKYNNTDYMRANLLGKTLRFSTDLTGAGCGCNAAFYLTSMGHNTHVSECFDHYCDANNVCGQSCAEIDLMEANQHAWHSTLHTATDTDGAASGFGGGGNGWNGPRNWTEKEYGIGGSCIDTAHPFDVAVSFPIDRHGTLVAMQVSLSQKGHSCQLQARVDNYASGMKELTHALLDGMTPIVSYWADDDMLWMDGLGDDKLGPCKKDSKTKCADAVKFFDFSIEDLDDKGQTQLEAVALKQDEWMAIHHPQPDGDSLSSGGTGGDQEVEGSSEWDGQAFSDGTGGDQKSEGGNEWWHPDDEEAATADLVMMKKNEVSPGRLRGAADSGGPSMAPYFAAAFFAGFVAVFAAVAVPLRRRRTQAAQTAAGEAGVEASPGPSASMSRWRSFGSLGDLASHDSPTTPTPMLQQPPSTQNLLMMGSLETQAA